MPNQDYRIQPFEVLKEDEQEIVVRTGFGTTVRRVHDRPMAEYVGFELDSIDKVRTMQFDSPWDERRFFRRGDDHLNGAGGDDIIRRDIAPFVERVKEFAPDFAVFGHVEEAAEYMIHAIGQANMLLWIGLYPDEMARFVARINEFELELADAQIKAAGGLLDGMMIGGDVAYTKAMFFSPTYWRKYFKPGVKAIVDAAHGHGMPVIYHGCGNVAQILDDLAEIGVDGYHPLEVKAGLDVIELRRKMGHRLAFVGNNDVRLWAKGDLDELRGYTLRKLNAAKGGGYFFGSDHSVPGDVAPETYDHLVKLVRQYGNYPLQLGEYDIPDLT